MEPGVVNTYPQSDGGELQEMHFHLVDVPGMEDVGIEPQALWDELYDKNKYYVYSMENLDGAKHEQVNSVPYANQAVDVVARRLP